MQDYPAPVLEADETQQNAPYTDYRFYQKQNGRDYMAHMFWDSETGTISEIEWYSCEDSPLSSWEDGPETTEEDAPQELVARVKAEYTKAEKQQAMTF